MGVACYGTHLSFNFTAGLEDTLDVMLLDLFAQCAAVQMVLRVQGRNQSSWVGIGHGHLRGHLLWGDKILKGVELKGDCTDKREIKDLSYDRWKMRWTCLLTCCQAKFWLEDPGSLDDALACLDHLTLDLALQARMGHKYLNYHHDMVGSISKETCQFCLEECEQFIHHECKCPALARVCLDTVQGHQLYRPVMLMKVDHIGRAVERRAEQVKFTGGLATPGINVLQCLPPTGAGKDPTYNYFFLLLGYSFPLRYRFNKQRQATEAEKKVLNSSND